MAAAFIVNSKCFFQSGPEGPIDVLGLEEQGNNVRTRRNLRNSFPENTFPFLFWGGTHEFEKKEDAYNIINHGESPRVQVSDNIFAENKFEETSRLRFW